MCPEVKTEGILWGFQLSSIAGSPGWGTRDAMLKPQFLTHKLRQRFATDWSESPKKRCLKATRANIRPRRLSHIARKEIVASSEEPSSTPRIVKPQAPRSWVSPVARWPLPASEAISEVPSTRSGSDVSGPPTKHLRALTSSSIDHHPQQ